MSWGDIISGIGGGIGGVVGAIGSKSAANQQYWLGLSNQKMAREFEARQREQLALQRHDSMRQIQYRVDDAKAAGIHPLAALGVGGGMSGGSLAAAIPPTPEVGGGHYTGDAIGAGAQALGSAVSGFEARRAARRAAMEAHEQNTLQKDYTRAQIDEVRSRTFLNNMRAAAVGGPVSPSTDIVTNPGSGQVITNPLLENTRIGSHTPAQVVEDQYGGIAGEVYGLGSLIYDRASQAPERWSRRWDAVKSWFRN